ncbi:hypothetical protein B4119_2290 [Parageobacillus caldoxylosilyticus]|uniref:Uncharacterized protein n=1 Tax=Saccharococcus caldoxylosilyticus TaxID=81408 RepID=A0A150LHC6_9BACL|nr:hypothetical protein B4119_2290 [Parageobacillus caldoxylosilyticus]
MTVTSTAKPTATPINPNKQPTPTFRLFMEHQLLSRYQYQ